MIYTIYGIYQDNTDLVYIGSTRTPLKFRFKKHCYVKTGGMYNVIKSIGKEHFSIKKICDGLNTAKETFKLEGEIIKTYLAKGYKLYNKSFGCVPNEETRKKLSLAGMGKTPTIETRIKLSVANKGKQNFLGKHHSKETKELKSKIMRNRVEFSKPILCVEQNIIYPSIREAMRKTGIDRAHISSCCQGKQKTSGGYHWKFVS